MTGKNEHSAGLLLCCSLLGYKNWLSWCLFPTVTRTACFVSGLRKFQVFYFVTRTSGLSPYQPLASSSFLSALQNTLGPGTFAISILVPKLNTKQGTYAPTGQKSMQHLAPIRNRPLSKPLGPNQFARISVCSSLKLPKPNPDTSHSIQQKRTEGIHFYQHPTSI